MEREWLVSFRPLAAGFIASVFLTLAAYWAVIQNGFVGWAFGLGACQAALQLVCFLHVGIEPKPRWNLIMFFFMLLVMVIIVFGSIWIMKNLNYNLMT